MISPYVQMAARRARILGAGSEPVKTDPGFDVVSSQVDPTMPDDHACDAYDDHDHDHMVWVAMMLIGAISFILGWLAVSGLSGD